MIFRRSTMIFRRRSRRSSVCRLLIVTSFAVCLIVLYFRNGLSSKSSVKQLDEISSKSKSNVKQLDEILSKSKSNVKQLDEIVMYNDNLDQVKSEVNCPSRITSKSYSFPYCSRMPCLNKLTPDNAKAEENQQPETDHKAPPLVTYPILKEVKRQRIFGQMNPVHRILIPLLSNIQWHNKVYGSVAQFGVGIGELATIMTQSLNTSLGERLVVADNFKAKLPPSFGSQNQFEMFRHNMMMTGFDESYSGPKRLYIHRGTLDNLVESFHFVKNGIPQFRIIGMNVGLKNNSFPRAMNMVSCLLLDGGILMVDGVDSLHHTARLKMAALDKFFAIRGNVLRPFMLAGNKMFITTGNYNETYVNEIKANAKQLELGYTHGPVGRAARNVLRILAEL